MNTTTEHLRTASSPPFILDSDMLGSLDSDPDFEFFDCNQLDAATSPGVFLTEESAVDGSQFLGACGSPSFTNKSTRPARPALLDTKVQSLSTPSSTSPTESDRDSSSESSKYKHNLSSNSSPSALTSGDMMMADTDMGEWKVEDEILEGAPSFGEYDGTINPLAMDSNFSFSDKAMENDFDFESASSSPSPLRIGSVEMDSPDKLVIKHDPPRKNSSMMKSKVKPHNKHNYTTHSTNGFPNTGSREASPLSAMVTSQESSPSALFNNSPSPSAGHDFYNGKIPDGAAPNQPWTYFGYPQNGLSHLSVPTMPTSQTFHGIGPPCVLLIHPTPLKSRVETQIPIKLSLFPLPLGIKRLHLPTHTISKPKLLAKPPLERSPDTLELYTTLVCTSAMRNPEYRRRAFARAAAASRESDNEEPSSEHTDEDDENKPLNGGEVKICAGCITRERKRAARKKIKKVEEEESWHKDEAKRVVVFNAQEIKDWQPPTSQTPSDATGDRPEPFIPEGAMQVDAPMRIACYCRHQNEKLGFQVIFTIKDYQDRLLAQEITNSIMITDDHKTHSLPAVPTRTSLGSDGLFSGSGAFPMDNTFNMSTGPVVATAPPNASPPSSDLQSLQNLNMQFQNPSDLAASHASQTTSATITPRTMSRQTSPSSGPSSKKRKASGVPSGLAMTKLEAPEGGVGQGIPPAPISATASTAPSPYSSNLQSFSPSDQPFGQPPIQQYNASPLTPNSNDQFSNANRSRSMENLAMQHPMFSAPPSSHPSRTSSPNGLRNSVQVYQQQQAQFAQAVASGLYSMPLSLNPHRPPTIHKLIPNEGPRAGGIEVTCLGSGFCQGLEVMFGDSKATTTTYWGETSLVCLLPPSAFAGTVPVTFKHQHQPTIPPHFPPIPKQQAHFKYVDDDEQQIIRTALAVLGHKMTGKMEDVRDLARRIVGDGNSSWGASTTGAGQNHTMSSFNSASFGVDVEATLLRCLDLIDLDDSPNMPRLNLRRASGQTMLHLACSLGLNRFVAALLARGANPEPRDKGGFTPMHFAALHNHPQIVRRLMLSGADPTLRSLQGYTPSDMATSEEVLRAARRIEHHRRTRSASSLKSRASSVTSLPSVWEPASTPSLVPSSSSEESDGDKEYEDDDADAPDDDAFWMRSTRRPSAPKLRKESIVDEKDPILELPPNIGPTGGFVSPAAAMTAFRDQLTAHIQHLQHTMHLNLPNLPQLPPLPPMPTFPMMPALPDYQAYLPTAPMVRRIGNLVGNRGDNATQQDYKWWDLFSGSVPAAPPAYEDIFPEDSALTKQTSAVQAAADTVADNKCAELFDQTESTTSAESSKSAQKRPVKLDTVRIGQKHVITKEQQDQLRLAHAEKVKRLSRDRNLFFIWIPLLVVIIVAMLCNRLPTLLSRAPAFNLPNHSEPERPVEVP